MQTLMSKLKKDNIEVELTLHLVHLDTSRHRILIIQSSLLVPERYLINDIIMSATIALYHSINS